MTTTPIQWTDVVWNPLRGCSRVSEGCRNCYAERTAFRFSKPGEPFHGLVVKSDTGPRWTGDIRLMPDKLGEPLSWRKPKMVFVNSMSDLFHPKVPFEFIASVFGIMAASRRHTFQVLTKRPERAREFFAWVRESVAAASASEGFDIKAGAEATLCAVYGENYGQEALWRRPGVKGSPWPLPNVWLGTSVENQKTADDRIPELLQCPAAVRWVSAEPLLKTMSLTTISDGSFHDAAGGAQAYDALRGVAYWRDGDDSLAEGPKLDWVVVGGESGPRARPCNIDRIRLLVEECRHARVPVFVKQLGHYAYDSDTLDWTGKHPKGGDPSEWPPELRVRQYPENKA